MSANKSDSTPHRRSDDANRVPDNTNIAEAVVPPLVGVSTTGNDPAEDSDHAEKVSPPTSTTSKNSSFRPPVKVRQLCYSLWPPSAKEYGIQRLLGGPNNRFLGVLRSKKLGRFLWPPSPPKAFEIEHMAGGSFNRITGVKIIGSEGENPIVLVLRTPRNAWDSRPDREVATLEYIRHHTAIPVPQIKAFDFSEENPLKGPYVVQNRIPGLSFETAIRNGISHKQWCTMAKEIGLLLLELQKIKNPAPGLIEASTKDDGVQAFTVCPFDIRHPFDLEWKVKQATSKTLEADNEKLQYWYEKDTFHFFASQFGGWRAEELQSSPISILWNDQMHRLTDVVSAMNRLGIFDKNHNCLTHMDLAPRNIMVETGPDDFIKITAILDWDGTFFAPKFVSCRPPWWLWQDEQFPEDAMAEETNADVKPKDPELLEVKSLFEATVGDEYIRFAYQPQYGLARRLFQIALYGNYSSWSVNEIKKILDDWEDLYKVGFENNESRSDPASPKSVALEDGNDSQGELESQVH